MLLFFLDVRSWLTFPIHNALLSSIAECQIEFRENYESFAVLGVRLCERREDNLEIDEERERMAEVRVEKLLKCDSRR